MSEVNSENPSSVEAINLRISKARKPVEEDIPKVLKDLEETLQATLSSSLKFQDETDGLMRWLSKMEIALKSQSPLSADETISKRQKAENSYLEDDIARYFIESMESSTKFS